MAKTFASSVPVHNLPVGNPGEKDSAGNLGVHRHLPRFFTRLVPLCTPKSASVSRRNFFCPDSPPSITYSPGLKTHNLLSPSRPPTVPAAFSFLDSGSGFSANCRKPLVFQGFCEISLAKLLFSCKIEETQWEGHEKASFSIPAVCQ